MDGLRRFYGDRPDLVVLDIAMPVMDGWQVLERLREVSGVPVLILTAATQERDELRGLRSGADDYITKPIKPRALMSRISALFRKESKNKSKPQVVAGDLTIDRSSYTVSANGNQFTLPKKEFELLYFLAQNPNKVYSRDELLQNIWGTDVYVLARTVDVHIRKVREKIGDGYISTVKGVGYKFEVN
mgnify:CR=1 FL=1